MSVSDHRPNPSGTVYGGRRAVLPQDPLMRVALAVGLVGVLLGVLFATGVLDGDEPMTPVAAGTPSTAAEPTPAASEPDPPTTPAEPSPTAAPTTAPAPVAGPKTIRAVTSGLCLDAGGAGERTPAQLADCTGGPEQQWVVNPLGPDTVTLTNAAHGQCLDVEGGSTDGGAKLLQFPCHGQANQQWRLTPTGSGPILLVAVHSGQCVQVGDGDPKAGDDIDQQPCSGGPTQQWTLD